MTSTTAAVSTGDGAGFELAEVEFDDLRHDEVLVDIVAVGMCHTDISASTGVIPFPLPGVLGHEGAGRIVAVGSSVTRVGVGDAVVLSFTSCGRCRQCRSGHPAYCEHHLTWNLLGGRRADGSATLRREGVDLNGHFFGQSSFARLAVADERSVVRLDPATTDDELVTYAPLGCGLQTGAGTILNVLKPPLDSTVAISGAGAVGLSALMAAVATSVHTVVVIDVVASRLELALELGATHVINAAEQDTPAELQRITGGTGVDFAIETTGNLRVLETMIGGIAIGGTCAVIGAPPFGSRASFDVNAHLPGRRIVGVTLGDSDPERFIPQLIELHRSGRFPLEQLLARYPFERINDAAADAKSGSSIKPVLVMKGALL